MSAVWDPSWAAEATPSPAEAWLDEDESGPEVGHELTAPPRELLAPQGEAGAGQLWVPGAERVANPRSRGGTYVGGPWRFIFHTVEGRPSAADFRRLAARHTTPPHLWAMPTADLLLQTIPLDRSAYALARPRQVHTNRRQAVQVEVWGFARDMAAAPPEVLEWLARRVLAPVTRLVPINLTNVRPAGSERCYGLRSPCRMSAEQWQRFDGVCGHKDVPDNAHWDPGGLDMAEVAARARAWLAGRAPAREDGAGTGEAPRTVFSWPKEPVQWAESGAPPLAGQDAEAEAWASYDEGEADEGKVLTAEKLEELCRRWLGSSLWDGEIHPPAEPAWEDAPRWEGETVWGSETSWEGEAAEYGGPDEVEGEGGVGLLTELLAAETGAAPGLLARVSGLAALAVGPPLRRGSTGAAVAALQRVLADLGHPLTADGDFGSRTEQAVRGFQGGAGLTVDGVVGPATWARLVAAAAAGPSQAGTPADGTVGGTPGAGIGAPGGDVAPAALGTLTLRAPGRTFTYRFTPQDLVWTAKLLVHEAGGRDDPDNAAVLWAMFNRYALFAHTVYRTFSDFVRAYSTTLQPVLLNKAAAARHAHKPPTEYVRTGGSYPVDHHPRGQLIARGQLRKHLDIQSAPWDSVKPSARALTTRALTGQLPNPGIGLASEFASTLAYWQQQNKRKNRPSPEEWRRFTMAHAAKKRWRWIGDIPGIDQMKNAFFLDLRAASLPTDAVQVVAPGATASETEWESPWQNDVSGLTDEEWQSQQEADLLGERNEEIGWIDEAADDGAWGYADEIALMDAGSYEGDEPRGFESEPAQLGVHEFEGDIRARRDPGSPETADAHGLLEHQISSVNKPEKLVFVPDWRDPWNVGYLRVTAAATPDNVVIREPGSTPDTSISLHFNRVEKMCIRAGKTGSISIDLTIECKGVGNMPYSSKVAQDSFAYKLPLGFSCTAEGDIRLIPKRFPRRTGSREGRHLGVDIEVYQRKDRPNNRPMRGIPPSEWDEWLKLLGILRVVIIVKLTMTKSGPGWFTVVDGNDRSVPIPAPFDAGSTGPNSARLGQLAIDLVPEGARPPVKNGAIYHVYFPVGSAEIDKIVEGPDGPKHQGHNLDDWLRGSLMSRWDVREALLRGDLPVHFEARASATYRGSRDLRRIREYNQELSEKRLCAVVNRVRKTLASLDYGTFKLPRAQIKGRAIGMSQAPKLGEEAIFERRVEIQIKAADLEEESRKLYKEPYQCYWDR